MEATKVIFGMVLFCFVAWYSCDALECCAEYTDIYGNTKPAELCQDFCCLDISISTFTKGSLRTCCSDEIRRIPAAERTTDCIKSWISQNIWVPIVGGIALIVIIICIVACCCCCGRR